MKIRRTILPLLCAVLPLGYQMPALATNTADDGIKEFLMHSKVTGNIRSYYFNQIFSGSDLPNRYAYSLGGMLKIQTASLAGVSAGVAFYTANDLGANDLNGPRLDPLLMGNRNSLNVLGQAYLQYRNRYLLVRAGDILLNTPWMGPADAFMIPNTYQAALVRVTPFAGLSVSAFREFRYKNRVQENYFRQTLLNENPLYPGMPKSLNGTLGFGLQENFQPFKSAFWFYHFYDLANLFYGTLHYTLPSLGLGVKPFADFQYVREWGDGARYAGPVNATIYGGMLGIKSSYGELFAAYDELPSRTPFVLAGKTFYNGGFISPFSQQYNADPLYTSIMNYGLVSVSKPGHAWKVGFLIYPLDHLRIKYSYSWYHTAPFASNVNANYLDVTYTPQGFWKGLSLRNRLAVDHSNPLAGYKGTLIDDRLMLQYSF